MEQAYGFANFHENGVFSDASPDGIGNGTRIDPLIGLSEPAHMITFGTVAIRTTLPSIFSSLNRIANASDPLKLALDGISYKPFISYFNLTAASADVNGDGVYEPLFGIGEQFPAVYLRNQVITHIVGS